MSIVITPENITIIELLMNKKDETKTDDHKANGIIKESNHEVEYDDRNNESTTSSTVKSSMTRFLLHLNPVQMEYIVKRE